VCLRMPVGKHAISAHQNVIFIRHIYPLVLYTKLLLWDVFVVWTEMLELCIMPCVYNVYT
jgi:hypothetical protein